MKKLMIAAALMAMAIASQAAYVKWNSGAFVDLPSCSGEFGIGYGDVKGFIYEFASDQGFANAAAVWDAYTSGALDKAVSDGVAKLNTGTSSTSNGQLSKAGDKGYNENQPIYAAIIYLHSDDGTFTKDGADYYMANYASQTATNSGNTKGNLGSKWGGSGAKTEWTAVPEPTSGLLLLLGVAGLALRRRRA